MIIIKAYKVNLEKNKLILPAITILKMNMPETENWTDEQWFDHLILHKEKLKIWIEEATHEKVFTLQNYRFRVFISGGKNNFKTLFPVGPNGEKFDIIKHGRLE